MPNQPSSRASFSMAATISTTFKECHGFCSLEPLGRTLVCRILATFLRSCLHEPGLDFSSNWGADPVQTDFGNDRTRQQQIEGFEDGSQQSYRPTESSWSVPWTEYQLMI